MPSTYISVTDTSKLMRKALKKAFPKTVFSVKSNKYAGGASIDVRWTDGPAAVAVEQVAKAYQGGGFDGMIDMKYNYSSWLLADGSVAGVANNPGTSGSTGVYAPENNPAPLAGATEVRFGADFVFCTRKMSPALMSRAVARLAAKGYPVETVAIEVSDYDGAGVIKVLTRDLAATRGFDMEREVRIAAAKTFCA